MFDLGKLGAAVTLDDSGFVNTLGGLENKAKATFSKIARTGFALLGVGSVLGLLKKSVDAYIVQADAVNGLERALKQIGQGDYKSKLLDVAKGLQDVTTYGDEATIQAMTLGVNMGITADRMEEATKAAMGLAAQYKRLDVNTAMDLIAKAAAGNTRRLKMFNIQLDESKSKQEQFNELLKIGGNAFPLATVQTFGQKLKQAANAFGDLLEQIGEFLISLFDLDDGVQSFTKNITTATEYIKDNLDSWAFEIQYVYEEFRMMAKNVVAVFEPLVAYLTDLFKDGLANITSLFQWAFNNAEKIWDNLPDLFWANLKDVWGSFKKFAEMVNNLFVNLSIAIGKAIRGGGREAFDGIWEDLQKDWEETLVAGVENKLKVLDDIGAEMPEMVSTANFQKMVEQYMNLNDKFNKNFREKEERQLEWEDKFIKRRMKKLAGNEKGNGSPNTESPSDRKNDVQGSFSAAVLNAMLGNGSPEKETARNTKKMVEQQAETNRKLEAFTYA